MNAGAHIKQRKTATPLLKPEAVQQGMAHDLPVTEADFKDTALPAILRPRRALPLRTLAAVIAVLFAGVLLGIASAYVVIERERPFLAVTIGPWSTFPKAGTADADPYSVAVYTRSARVPLANGEGLAFSARTDSAGRELDPECSYRISGTTPTARLWTLSASDRHGRLVPTVAGRVHLSSHGLLRREDGSFSVIASNSPHSGNWLPTGRQSSADTGLMFTFRLYDAPITTGSAVDGAVMPTIERLSCP